MINKQQLKKLYWEEELSIEKIGKKLGISDGTIFSWMVKYNIPRRSRSESAKKRTDKKMILGLKGAWKKKIKHPNLKPSNELCYIIGVILFGDGSITTKKYKIHHGKYTCFINRISLTAKNLKFIESFRLALQKIGLNPPKIMKVKYYPPKIMKVKYYGKKFYRVDVNSKIFCSWILTNYVKKRNEEYKGKKKAELNFVKLENLLKKREFILSFLRGFFESDGSYYYETNVKRPYVSFGKSNKKSMEFIFKLIKKLDYNPKLYKVFPKTTIKPRGFDYYLIHMRRKNEPERFIKEIKPVIKNTPSNRWDIHQRRRIINIKN